MPLGREFAARRGTQCRPASLVITHGRAVFRDERISGVFAMTHLICSNLNKVRVVLQNVLVPAVYTYTDLNRMLTLLPNAVRHCSNFDCYFCRILTVLFFTGMMPGDLFSGRGYRLAASAGGG